MKILFVCTGNTCRSPMAEALLKKKAPKIQVQSAGIFAQDNGPISPQAQKALENRQMLVNPRSQSVNKDLIKWADLVLTMTTSHKQSLIVQFPQEQQKFFTLKEYVSDADKKVWDQLKKMYADVEEKRSLFLQKNKTKWNTSELEEKADSHVREDWLKINQLERKLISYDISDPFGGDLSIYEETLHELEKYIDLLIKKINR